MTEFYMSSSAPRTAPATHDGISKRNFDQLANFIYNYSGIKMPPTKLTMLEGRLRRRLRATGKPTFEAYCQYLFKEGGLEHETIYLIDAVTTNKTDFFREPNHFTFMRNQALPDLIRRGARGIRAWSSACSTGAEPYTMAMVLAEYAAQHSDINYQILATDLSTEVLDVAKRGIYPAEMIEPVPAELRQRYVMRAVERGRQEVRIVPRLRSKIGFGRLNLMDDSYAIGDPVQIIFCRNVMIYFDKETQAEVLSRLCDCLVPGGYLFIGHSETISGLDLPLKTVANTVFQRI
jgi:chemotaxis protein methyltransferase CheR